MIAPEGAGAGRRRRIQGPRWAFRELFFALVLLAALHPILVGDLRVISSVLGTALALTVVHLTVDSPRDLRLTAALGIPFVASGIAINGFFAAFGRFKRHMQKVEWVAGGLLIAVGVLLMTDRLTLLAQYFTKLFPGLAEIG